MLVWPAFLAACLLEVLFFAVVDPGEIHFPGAFFHSTRMAVYTLAFLVFWIISMGCGATVLWLSKPQRKLVGVSDTPAG